MILNVKKITEDLIAKYEANTNKAWKGSPFEFMYGWSNDERGKFGEEWLLSVCQDVANLKCQWDGDSNTRPIDGGTYDMIINLIKRLTTEIKTAMSCASSANWQHENIYAKSVWDKLTFLDFDYDKIYITVLMPSNMTYLFQNEQDPILGKKATLRESQEDKWKFDYSRRTLANSIKAGYTFTYDWNNPDDAGLIAHLLKHFG
jgi:hypothetical protein